MNLEQEIHLEQRGNNAPLLRMLSRSSSDVAGGGGGGGENGPGAAGGLPLKGLLKPPPEERTKRKVAVCWAPDNSLEQVLVFHKQKSLGNGGDVIVGGPPSATDVPEADTDIPSATGMQAHLKACFFIQ